jgi:carnosine N-methyltransferase
VEAIQRMLKPGGVWINLGPLLYHWAVDAEANEDPRYDQSVEVRTHLCKYVCMHVLI